jgi:hypothetical protein
VGTTVVTEPDIFNIARGQDVLTERVDNLKDDLNSKHKQNRDSIHGINNRIETLTSEIWMLKIKIVGYASGAGVLTAVLVKIIDHLWKS